MNHRRRRDHLIIMINGAFGSGKTSTANRLQSLIPNSMIYDPEEVGYMLRNIITEDMKHEEERTDDFQDMELWRVLVVQTAEQLHRKYNRHLIIPMTIYKAVNFRYISEGLSRIDEQLFHFCLIASEDTLQKRIEQRGDVFGEWYQQHSRRAVAAFQDEQFQQHIVTDDLDTDHVIQRIIHSISNDTKSEVSL